MKKPLLSLMLTLLLATTFCQKIVNTNQVTTDISIIVDEIDEVKLNFDLMLKECNVVPVKYSTKHNSFDITLEIDSANYFHVLHKSKSWGLVIDEKTSSNQSNKVEVIKRLNHEIQALESEMNQYEELTSGIKSTHPTLYFQYKEKIISLGKTLSEKRIRYETLIEAKPVYNNYTIYLTFLEEKTVGDTYRSLWVNMPGLEFSILHTEQPKEGVNPDYMIGYNLKYLINHKKTYATVGMYKAPKTSKTVSEIDEMYLFALGQDFYSKKWGGGRRKFFNLYSSVMIGVYINSSETTKSNSWFTNPFFGVELFKTKNVVIDSKVGYFLPFQNNRHQRGLLYNLSANFAF